MTSTFESGEQWDAPFGWAPLHLIAVQGLRRYGFTDAADRITMEFDSVVRDSYRRQGFIVEKYDVVRRGTEVGAIVFGYSANQAGFGWTNATFTALYDELPAALKQKLLPGETVANVAGAR
jgi:alpha,alpha-trehalase